MLYFFRTIKFILFIFLLILALQNSDAVLFRLFIGLEWQLPLIVLLLAFLILGMVLGVFAILPNYLKLKQQLSKAQNQHTADKTKNRVQSDPSDAIAN